MEHSGRKDFPEEMGTTTWCMLALHPNLKGKSGPQSWNVVAQGADVTVLEEMAMEGKDMTDGMEKWLEWRLSRVTAERGFLGWQTNCLPTMGFGAQAVWGLGFRGFGV